MQRWSIKVGPRTFYIYAPSADDALERLAANAVSIGIENHVAGRPQPAGEWKDGRLFGDPDAILVEDNRKAPAA
jgi:hypothetical protein